MNPRDTPIPEMGSRWRHYKGGIYIIVGAAKREEDAATLIEYVKEDDLLAFLASDALPWSRPLHEWHGPVGPPDALSLPPRYEPLD